MMSVFDRDARLIVGDGPQPGRRRRLWRNHTLSVWARRAMHPRRTGWLGDAHNEYGTPVSVCRCAVCGQAYTVCPALSPAGRIPANAAQCGQPGVCDSYDPHRDPTFLITEES